MADKKISELQNITGANLADGDELVVVDASESETKAITFGEFKTALDTSTGFVRITGDTMTGDLSFSDNDKAIFGNGSDLQIYHDGSDSYVEDTAAGELILKSNGPSISFQKGDGTELFTVNTSGASTLSYSGNAKLATTSTGVDITGSDGLTVDAGSSTGTHLEITTTGNGHNFDMVDGGATTRIRNVGGVLRIGADHNDEAADSYIQFDVDNSERMRITSDGSVGIGNTSSGYVFTSGETRLAVGDGSEHAAIQIYSGTAKWGGLEFADDATNGTGQGFIGYYHPSDYMQFNTNGSEAARLDASGNLLVGKTSSNSNVLGVEFRPSGRIFGCVDGNSVGVFNRKTSDGDIVEFRKDNSTVGRIGTIGGGMYIGDGDTGLEIDGANNAIYPFNTSTLAVTDGHTDLGDSDKRFKDLYLSGGVYLGGTGSANKLDDYEEGTWTPTVLVGGSAAGVSMTSQAGTYTKIGRLVSVSCRWRTSSKGSNTGGVELDGLPFTVANLLDTTGIESSASLGYFSGLSGTWYSVFGFASEATTKIGFYIKDASSGDPVGLLDTDINNIFDGRLSLVYYTT
jgi:hypothetical protein